MLVKPLNVFLLLLQQHSLNTNGAPESGALQQ